MCVIVAKTKTQKAPKIETLKTCFNNNPDGAGFMYVDNNRVIIDKGYMNIKDFIEHYEHLKNKYNNFNGKSLVIHFRISTSGKVTGAFTHPFTLSNNIEDMKKQHTSSIMGVAHNGILKDYTPENKKTNDTMLFIQKFLFNKYKHKKLFTRKTRKQIEKTGSKFAILTKNDNLHLYGDFIKDGVYFSNSTYKNTYYTCYNYDYYYDKSYMKLDDNEVMIYDGCRIKARYFRTQKNTRLYYDWIYMRIIEMNNKGVVSFTDGVEIDWEVDYEY